jgi:5-methylcytosine-specific restriction endonuclease McrA
MSKSKKEVRARFRETCLKRDRYQCVGCGYKPADPIELDVHHITDRNEMPNGGYVKENGISLCGDCHVKAEVFHQTGNPHPGFSIDELYLKIGSSYPLAFQASQHS